MKLDRTHTEASWYDAACIVIVPLAKPGTIAETQGLCPWHGKRTASIAITSSQSRLRA